MEHQTGELLSNLAVTIPSLRSEVGTLSGGQRQQVAVARSLLGEPKVVLLDEPTAALGVAQTAQVLELIRRLRERELGVVVISHNLVDVFEVADRIFVLRLGSAAGDFAAEATTEEHVVSAITGVGCATARSRSDRGGGAMSDARRRTADDRGERSPTDADHAALRPGRPRLAAGGDRPGPDLGDLPVRERPLPLGPEPDQPDAADHRDRADLGRHRLRPAAR